MTDLPLELLLLILDNISVRELASLSLCSHQIRILVFPLLYRRAVFNDYENLYQFSARVISEAGGENLVDELRVADHVRYLEFRRGYDLVYAEDSLELLTLAVQHMKALGGFTWSALLPRDPAIFYSMQKACKGLHDLSLRLNTHFEGGDEAYMTALFGFRGLKRLEFSTRLMSIDNRKLPSGIVDMIRASPNLITLELSLGTSGFPRPTWDIDTLFQSVDIAPTTLRLRRAADLDLHAFSNSASPTPFRSFLLFHHEGITSLALPAPREDFARGPPSLNLQPDMLPALREFEGTIYWCSQLSKLQVASKLRSLAVLLEHPLFEDDNCDMFLEALRAFTSLRALVVPDGDTVLSAEQLKVIVDYAPHLDSLMCGFNRHETADAIGSQLSRLNLRTFGANIFQFDRKLSPEEVVRTLAKYCASLVTVEAFYQRHYGICWVATIHRKEGGVDLEVSRTHI